MDYSNFSLDQWLEHIQKQHWRSIELQLDRVTEVWKKLGGKKPPFVITVAGTNGKGSCVAMLESVFRHAGQSTGSYTSPHLVRYNERVCINGVPVEDDVLSQAFCEVESARSEIPLTYFEFGTLCALLIFQQHKIQCCILETGMGGRLDAVNIIENDIALITSVGIDHEQWLGSDREIIGAEKAGIFKCGALAICADISPPTSVSMVAEENKTTLLQVAKDFYLEHDEEAFSFHSAHPEIPKDWNRINGLTVPISGTHQIQNLAGVMAVLAVSQRKISVSKEQLMTGLAATRIVARCQVIGGTPKIIVDVAHNADSAQELTRFLAKHQVTGKTLAVLGVLGDKDLGPILKSIAPHIDHWLLATLEGERGQNAAKLGSRLEKLYPTAQWGQYANPVKAFIAARKQSNIQDRIVIFGSFHTVGDIIGFLAQS